VLQPEVFFSQANRCTGGSSGGTWIVNLRLIAASRGTPNLSHLYEIACLGEFRQFRAEYSKWIKRPLLYH
jgi:hypothetical protein